MVSNIGPVDRIIRILLGGFLFYMGLTFDPYGSTGWVRSYATLLDWISLFIGIAGGLLVFTGLSGISPIYSILKISRK